MAIVKTSIVFMMLLLSIVTYTSASSCSDAMNRNSATINSALQSRDLNRLRSAFNTVQSDIRACRSSNLRGARSEAYCASYMQSLENSIKSALGSSSWSSATSDIDNIKFRTDGLYRYC